MKSHSPRVHVSPTSSHRVPLVLFVATAFVAPITQANLLVDMNTTPLGGGIYRYEATITNPGPKDIAIVSLVDAPANDPILAPSLVAPVDFFAQYDGPLGIVDLLPNLAFLAGTVTPGFSFQSSSAPGSSLTLFEALTIDGDLLRGRIRYSNPGVPDASSTLVLLGLTATSMVALRGRTARRSSAA